MFLVNSDQVLCEAVDEIYAMFEVRNEPSVTKFLDRIWETKQNGVLIHSGTAVRLAL